LLTPENFDLNAAFMLEDFLQKMEERYSRIFELAVNHKDRLIAYMLEQNAELYTYEKNAYQNEYLTDIVRKSFEKNKILEYDYELVQQIDPIYKDPTTTGLINVRTHFFAPRKYFLGRFFDTYWFNISVIWLYSLLLYISLYFDFLKKFMDFFGKISFKRKK